MALTTTKLDIVRHVLDMLSIQLEPCIEIRHVPDDAEHIGVYATRDIDEGEPLGCIPKESVLSVVNTAAADILQSSELRGGLALNFAVLYEKHVMGPKSRWHMYLQSLPQRAYLPLFWRAEEAALLQGTEADGRAAADAPLLAEDFAVVEALLARHPDIPRAGFTLQSYMEAVSWVASRAFGVDSMHGISLVPLADIFNHKAAFVKLTDDYSVAEASCSGDGGSGGSSDNATDEVSGQDSGQSSGASSQQEEQPSQGADSAAGQSSDANATADQSSDDEDAATEQLWRPRIRPPDAAEDPRWRLEIAILDGERDGQEVVEVVAASAVAAGAEVHNCYGELSNCELVMKYGFALGGGNPFDRVSLDPDALVAAAQRHLGKAAARKRVAFLNSHSDLLTMPDDSLCIAPGAVLEAGLVAALWVLFAPPEAMKGADSMEEVAERLSLALAEAAVSAAQPNGNAAAGAAMQHDGRPAHPGGTLAAVTSKQQSGAAGQPAAAQRNSHAAEAGTADASEPGADLDDAGKAMLSDVPVIQAAAALPPAASAALADSIQQRLQRYQHADIAEDEAALAAAKLQPAGEAKAAKLAALTLVVAEKRILVAALAAVQRAPGVQAAVAQDGREAKWNVKQADGRNSKRARK